MNLDPETVTDPAPGAVELEPLDTTRLEVAALEAAAPPPITTELSL